MILAFEVPHRIGDLGKGIRTDGLNIQGDLSNQPWVITKESSLEAYRQQYISLGGDPEDTFGGVYKYFYEIQTD